MQVSLAGLNVESDLLALLTRRCRTAVTPESIAAAYARISRSPKPVAELRREARDEIERARRSNVSIVFEMGHHSVAEHAVFNFDVVGLSRLAVEALEHHRLNSYTEKSQRYVRVDEDFLVPPEVAETELRDEFVTVTRLQHNYYRQLLSKLVVHFGAAIPDAQLAENRAKEDARYITNLATLTQVGMTINARNLEYLIRALAASELGELRSLAAELFRQVEGVAPSLILFPAPTDYERRTRPRLREFAQNFMVSPFPRRPRNFIALAASDVVLVDYTQNADNKLLAALMHGASAASFGECVARTERQTLARKKEILKLVCQDMQSYDAVLREFEHLSLTFEVVLSASAFAQLKRHRLMTLTVQPYSPNHGWTIPQSVAEVKEHRQFKEILTRTEEAHARLGAVSPAAAQYLLTNSHQRRVLVTVNARELYHLARLREDAAAQWDIRDIAGRMVEQARHVMPLALMLACGKDVYPQTFEATYGRLPAVVKLELPRPRDLRGAGRPAGKPPVGDRQRRVRKGG
jgi:flavin-dependent thymidylate synthase